MLIFPPLQLSTLAAWPRHPLSLETRNRDPTQDLWGSWTGVACGSQGAGLADDTWSLGAQRHSWLLHLLEQALCVRPCTHAQVLPVTRGHSTLSDCMALGEDGVRPCVAVLKSEGMASFSGLLRFGTILFTLHWNDWTPLSPERWRAFLFLCVCVSPGAKHFNRVPQALISGHLLHVSRTVNLTEPQLPHL